ncbi:SpoVR family protein [Methylibium sp. T29]|nr:SpoVR family protein [Methylibium sp. T29]
MTRKREAVSVATPDLFTESDVPAVGRVRAASDIVASPRAKTSLPSSSDWTFELIDQYHDVIRETARGYGLDTYPNQLEIITAEQMMDAYASVGMPVNYRHWSYGKEFIATEKNYRRGHMGLAYEIVINSNPCISYLMEENSLAMQALVIAHAAYGHNSFFKGNYLFRMWTDASSIIDYLSTPRTTSPNARSGGASTRWRICSTAAMP